MEKSNLNDVRAVFLNMVLFGTKTAPKPINNSTTSVEFNSLLKLNDDDEKDLGFKEISKKYLISLNKRDRDILVGIIISNQLYNNLILLIYRLSSTNSKDDNEIIRFKINKDLINYINNAIITDSVEYYFRIMLDRLTLFDFACQGKINEREYLKISYTLLSNNMDDYFI